MAIRLLLISLILALSPIFSSAHASSNWVSGLGYKARLLEGERQVDGTYHAALEIALDDGWKTYWRVPGENGIPPTFEFDASRNVKDTKIHWPKPVVFKDGHGLSVGYKEHVVLPFTVMPEDLNEKVALNLSAFFGVCEAICVPANAEVAIQFDPQKTMARHQPFIDEAMAKVPLPAETTRFDVIQAAFGSSHALEYVHLRLRVPENTTKITVLTEGPQDWYFDPYQKKMPDVEEGTERDVEQALSEGETLTAKIPLYRVVREDLTGNEELRITVIADNKAIEKVISLR